MGKMHHDYEHKSEAANLHASSVGTITTNRARVPACNNGCNCDWLKKGRCSYSHPRVGMQEPGVKKGAQPFLETQTRQDN